MFAITRELQFGECTVTVKELTVAEVRAWLNEPAKTEEPEFDLLTGLLSFDGIGMEELHRFTDLKKDQVELLPPSALKQIACVIKELNSVFFNEYLSRLNTLKERLSATSELSNAA
jgi:hypothetical protein